MPKIDPTQCISFETPEKLKQWLKENHSVKSELWIKIFKKGSQIPSVNWEEIVLEVLCWGWIDGIKKSIDEQAYMQRITPRKAKSIWSKRNTEHVERLIREGRMQESGMIHVQAAQSDGRWDNAYSTKKNSK